MRSEYFESANSFTYNGINSLDMGLFITGQSAADSAAEPEIETVEVPARGILIQDNRIDTLDNQRFKDYGARLAYCQPERIEYGIGQQRQAGAKATQEYSVIFIPHRQRHTDY